MTLLQLRYFVETCHTGSTQRAAQKLNISQSTISVAIRSLEKELGVTLFCRTPRGLFLNEAGEELSRRGEELLCQFDGLVSEMEKYSFRKRQIRVGMPPLVNLSYWPDLFCCLSETFPNHSFESVPETRNVLLEMLKKGEIDLCVMHSRNPEPEFSGLEYRFLAKDGPPSVTMSIENPLAVRQTISYAEVVHEPLLGYRNGISKTESLRWLYASYGVDLHYVQECTQFSVLLELLKKNIGIAYLNERAIRECEDLVNIPISGVESRGDLYLLHNGKIPEKLCRVVAAAFRESMKKPESS